MVPFAIKKKSNLTTCHSSSKWFWECPIAIETQRHHQFDWRQALSCSRCWWFGSLSNSAQITLFEPRARKTPFIFSLSVLLWLFRKVMFLIQLCNYLINLIFVYRPLAMTLDSHICDKAFDCSCSAWYPSWRDQLPAVGESPENVQFGMFCWGWCYPLLYVARNIGHMQDSSVIRINRMGTLLQMLFDRAEAP